MIRDNRTTFGDALAATTGSTSATVIGDGVDLGSTGRNIGAGVPPLFFVVRVDTAVTGTSSTYNVELITSDSSTFASGNVTVLQTGAIAEATLVAGYFMIKAPLPSMAYKRYLGIRNTAGVAALTAGKIDAFLVEDVNALDLYPDGI